MPGLSSPIRCLLVDDVVYEAYEFRPQRPFLPEEAINRDSESQAEERADETCRDDGAQGKSDVGMKKKVSGVTSKKNSDFRAKHYACHGEKTYCSGAASSAGCARGILSRSREEITHSQRSCNGSGSFN